MSVVAREIGGYFGLEAFSGSEYHHDLIGVNSGRNALLYILKARQIQKLYIPRFLCDSVSALCKREGICWEGYSLDDNFLPVFDKALDDGEWLYIVNYYGQISNEQVIELKERYGNIIFDNVQAFFQLPVKGIDTVYSCRKFFGVPDGGYVACYAPESVVLDMDTSRDWMKHILGRFEESGSAFYRDFQENDERFYEVPLRGMSELTRNILRAVNYEAVRKQRNANYELLECALGKANKLRLKVPDGPYCYPFYCKNGMEIKRKLASVKIYVPTLWPNVLTEDGVSSLERDYAENILPLPCDQRYSDEDMRRVAEEVKKCIV